MPDYRIFGCVGRLNQDKVDVDWPAKPVCMLASSIIARWLSPSLPGK